MATLIAGDNGLNIDAGYMTTTYTCSGPRSSTPGPEIQVDSGTGFRETVEAGRPTFRETQPAVFETGLRSEKPAHIR